MQPGIVYSVFWNIFHKDYIGQSKRLRKTRLTKHIKQNKKEPTTHTKGKNALTAHPMTKEHCFNLLELKILHHEPVLSKRLIHEMVYITDDTLTVNYRMDIDGLITIYNLVVQLNN